MGIHEMSSIYPIVNPRSPRSGQVFFYSIKSHVFHKVGAIGSSLRVIEKAVCNVYDICLQKITKLRVLTEGSLSKSWKPEWIHLYKKAQPFVRKSF